MPGIGFFNHGTSPSTSMASILPLDSKHPAPKRRWSSNRSSSENVRPKPPIRTMPKSSSGRGGLKGFVESPADIIMTIESPPLVCYGPPKESTGALLCGIMKLEVKEAEQTFEAFTMRLLADVLTRKPVSAHCSDCATSISELHKWPLISEPVVLKQGTHTYPFSYLLPGHLPASNNNVLSRITYCIYATATTIKGDEIKFERSITLQRAVLPGPDKHSTRVFPPTNLSANVTLPSVVHPGGDFPLQIRLDGILSKARTTRWRLKKLTWRIDETSRVVSPACKQHSSKLGGDGKGLLHDNVRTVGSGEVKSGWKSDYAGTDGKIEVEFDASIPAHADAACDVDSPCGISVSHNLVVEMIVAEENCPVPPSRLVNPTGAARVLRMQFHLPVTERSGLGISWDEETPPVYENIPASPPSYGTVLEIAGEAGVALFSPKNHSFIHLFTLFFYSTACGHFAWALDGFSQTLANRGLFTVCLFCYVYIVSGVLCKYCSVFSSVTPLSYMYHSIIFSRSHEFPFRNNTSCHQKKKRNINQHQELLFSPPHPWYHNSVQAFPSLPSAVCVYPPV
ncbi:hypothetical protein C7212DRAFT_169338 [Tuber magnatum]|uniref:LDB19 N-terminal domain-containing protein n=1 Tax=Tuber magnatum TaxID=42249 RepID=A0A317SYG9_9PEZI|nr:hypothetical protein C7212DRAFT_169338 [Tuber magnatum]